MNELLLSCLSMYSYLQLCNFVYTKIVTKQNNISLFFYGLMVFKTFILWTVFYLILKNYSNTTLIIVGAFLGKSLFCIHLYTQLKLSKKNT